MPRLRTCSNRSLESLQLFDDMAENNEVVSGSAQLFDELTNCKSKIMGM